MWVEEEGLVFVQSRDANRAPIEPCAEVAAHRPRFVWAARNASSEDWTLHSTACRHQDSQESSGDDKMAPYRVRARAPSSGSERSGCVWRRTRPDAAWQHFVVIGRFLAVLMPTGGDVQGKILA